MLALAISPLAGGLFRGAISMSGSPRLSATFRDAATHWHPAVVNRTACAGVGARGRAALAECLHGLSASELQAAEPPDWDAAGFSLAVFEPSFESVGD